MNDDSFRLTPIDVRHQTFTRGMRGYDIPQVEDFKVRVAEELDRLTRANQDLDQKAKNLIEQLRSFRERDKALNDALVSAQQLRSEIREQSEREAQLILREARAEGERLVDGTRGEVRRLEAELMSLEKTRAAYINHLRAIAERQLAELDAMEGTQPHRGSKAEDAPEPAPRPAKKTPAWLDSLVKE